MRRVGLKRKLRRARGEQVVVYLQDRSSLSGILRDVGTPAGAVVLRSLDLASGETDTILISSIASIRVVEMQKLLADASPFVITRVVLKVEIHPDGSVALAKSERLRSRSPGMHTYRDVITCSSDWDPRKVKSRVHPADENGDLAGELTYFPETPGAASQVAFEHSLDTPLVRGRDYVRETSVNFPKTYLTDEEDSFSHTIRQVEESFTVELRFPRDCSPPSVKVLTKKNEWSAPEIEAVVEVVGGKVLFSREKPAVGETFSLQWRNAEEVRKRVSAAS